ncbi:rhomboid family intramembrane serine protease [Schleiferiaceae bacterium]|nr:rhomboid family intramembrane serine protease [Schleiferiaceae bacterium]
MGFPFSSKKQAPWLQKINRWTHESWVHRWILILILCFILQTILEATGWLSGVGVESTLLRYAALPAIQTWNIGQVWTLFSYGFLHYGAVHLLLNGLMLYFAGHMLKTFWQDVQVARLFALGIVAGGVAYAVASYFYPQWPPLMGASGGVLALLLAATRMSPQMPVYVFGVLRLPLWAISLLLMLISISGLQGPNAGGNMAHLGGAAIGWIMAKNPAWLMRMNWTKRAKNARHQRAPLHVVGKDEHDLDGILDKISRVGYEALTAAEKEFLARYGKN